MLTCTVRTLSHVRLCIIAAAVAVLFAHLLDLWVLAAAAQTEADMMDSSYPWATAGARVGLGALFVSLAALVWRGAPSLLVGSAYFIAGFILTFAQPLALSAFPSWLMWSVHFRGAGVNAITAFLTALGAAVILHYASVRVRKGAQPDDATAGGKPGD